MEATTKLIMGIGMIVAGIIIGIYVGIWVCFIGGIVDVIEQIRSVNLQAMAVAWGVTKIFLAGVFGWLSALVFIVPGYGLVIKS